MTKSNGEKLLYFQSTMFTDFLPGAKVLDKLKAGWKLFCKQNAKLVFCLICVRIQKHQLVTKDLGLMRLQFI